jgi:hypothetical protein
VLVDGSSLKPDSCVMSPIFGIFTKVLIARLPDQRGGRAVGPSFMIALSY